MTTSTAAPFVLVHNYPEGMRLPVTLTTLRRFGVASASTVDADLAERMLRADIEDLEAQRQRLAA